MRMHNPPHPGAILRDALGALPMTISAFALHIGVSRVALSRVLNEKAGITAEMSIKLSEAFGQNAPDLWYNMQKDHDFWQILRKRSTRRKIEPVQPVAA